jgi:tRNA-Thr(GGU) m(6)t(6)A37 methyltransferase TsaA
MKRVVFEEIGRIHTPFKELQGMPIQPSSAKGIEGKVELFPHYMDGLKDIEGFSHIILIYYLHKSENFSLQVVPFLDTVKRGVFATRSPKRPNQIGISVVELVEVNDNILKIRNIDVLDQTPLLDIKPYVPEFDNTEIIRIGWLENARSKMKDKMSDDRFLDKLK